MTANPHYQKLATYLRKFFPGRELAPDDDIFSLGFVTSMFALQLVNFVEHEFGMTIENEDMQLDNFRSLGALVALVERKLAASPAA
jgi:methoxymalonate biosynthesis acyl carrier protein